MLSQLSYTPISLTKGSLHPLEDLRAFKIKQRLRTSLKLRHRIFRSSLTCRFGYSLLYPRLHRKEVIQPHLPIRLPCYDFTPVTGFTFGGSFLTVRSPTSGASNSHGVTGGVYKARERIHRGMLIRDY